MRVEKTDSHWPAFIFRIPQMLNGLKRSRERERVRCLGGEIGCLVCGNVMGAALYSPFSLGALEGCHSI